MDSSVKNLISVDMTKDTLKIEWHLVKENVRQRPGKPSDDDLTEKFDLIINTLL